MARSPARVHKSAGTGTFTNFWWRRSSNKRLRRQRGSCDADCRSSHSPRISPAIAAPGSNRSARRRKMLRSVSTLPLGNRRNLAALSLFGGPMNERLARLARLFYTLQQCTERIAASKVEVQDDAYRLAVNGIAQMLLAIGGERFSTESNLTRHWINRGEESVD